jgi:hypothetical protein
VVSQLRLMKGLVVNIGKIFLEILKKKCGEWEFCNMLLSHEIQKERTTSSNLSNYY